MRRVILALVAIVGVILITGWLVISAPFFGDLRANVAQGWLDKAGGGVKLTGPVNIDLGKVVHVTAEDISVDAPEGEASVAKVEADVSLSDLLHRKIDPTNIVITGAKVSLVRDAQGKLVGKTTDKAGSAPAPDAAAILAKLAGKTIRLVDSQASFQDQVSNFAFDAQLATLEVQGDPGNGVTSLKGSGTLNGQPLDVSIQVPKDAPLTASVTSGTTSMTFTGAEGSKGVSGALAGQIALDSPDLIQTLKILQLEPILKGKASARATLGRTDAGDPTLTGIEASATLDSGQSAQVSGALGNLRKLDDVDIAIDVNFYPTGQEPAPALLVKDLRLTAFRQTLAGPLKGDTRRSMTIATNGFTINTAGVGPAPVKLSQISRGPEGELVIGSVSIEIGPTGTPWLGISGRVGDLLRVSGLALDGKVDFPMSTIVGAGNKNLPTEMGSVTGQLKVSGSYDKLALTDVALATQGTDLWSLKISGLVASVVPLDGIDLAMDISVKAAAMLKALGKEPIDLAPLDLHVSLASTDSNGTVNSKLSMQMAKSNLSVDLSVNNRGAGPVIKGTASSDQIRLADLRDGLTVATDLFAAIHNEKPAEPGSKRPVTRSHPERQAQEEKQNDSVQNITIGLLDKDRLLNAGDVDIEIKLGKFAGKSAIRGIDAKLGVGKGKASLGPLKFAFDGGHFDLLATIDTIAAPKIVHLKGSSGGWSFGEIVKAMRVKIPASGTIDAEFDISGDHTSVADFINTLDGTTTLRMRDGAIATSLLDLAGLGVVPWLFSKDRKDKYATITCLRAPLDFKNGVVTTRESVVETPEVQLVAYGTINIPRRTLNVAGQPRPVGKPLTRSPWPFTLTGALTDPKVKVKDGPSKVRRADGANKMPAKRVPCIPDILQLK